MTDTSVTSATASGGPVGGHPGGSTPGALFEPVSLGALKLPNRIIMSPMSRLRSDENGVQPAYMAEYYAQRASAGLIIAETMAVAPYGAGYPHLPGLYMPSHIRSWQAVTNAVHERGGRIAAQLWHVGRPRYEEPGGDYQPGWAALSEVKPHELDHIALGGMVAGFAAGASAALAAGFDAVEIHNGNGFLLDRFLRSAANLRQDRYGGSLKNRTRLTLELVETVADVIGADRVGIRLSPSAPVNDTPDPTGAETFAYLLEQLAPMNLAYVHTTRVTEQDVAHGAGAGIPLDELRRSYSGRLIGAGEFTKEDGVHEVASGVLDAVAYGRLFLANPDLPRRFALNALLNAPRPETFYTPGPEGLTDYALLGEAGGIPTP